MNEKLLQIGGMLFGTLLFAWLCTYVAPNGTGHGGDDPSFFAVACILLSLTFLSFGIAITWRYLYDEWFTK